jgi:hypothetical protein
MLWGLFAVSHKGFGRPECGVSRYRPARGFRNSEEEGSVGSVTNVETLVTDEVKEVNTPEVPLRRKGKGRDRSSDGASNPTLVLPDQTPPSECENMDVPLEQVADCVAELTETPTLFNNLVTPSKSEKTEVFDDVEAPPTRRGFFGKWFGSEITRRARKENARESVHRFQGLDEEGEEDVEVEDERWSVAKALKKRVAKTDTYNSKIRHRAVLRWKKRAGPLKRIVEATKFQNAMLTQSPADVAYLAHICRKVVEDHSKEDPVVRQYKAWFLKAACVAYYVKSEDDELLGDVARFCRDDPTFV